MNQKEYVSFFFFRSFLKKEQKKNFFRKIRNLKTNRYIQSINFLDQTKNQESRQFKERKRERERVKSSNKQKTLTLISQAFDKFVLDHELVPASNFSHY